MEAIARKKFIRQSPYKIRYVLKTIKGLRVDDAINKLSLMNKKASIYIEEVRQFLSVVFNLQIFPDKI